MTAKPFLKWAGGKRKMLPELLARIPAEFGVYHEPFLGGGALFFALRAAGMLDGKKVVLSDLNDELITTWRAIRDDWTAVSHELTRHSARYGCGLEAAEKYYYATRELDWRAMAPHAAAARMIFINKTCFNGLHRVNASGLFNASWCRNADVNLFADENLMAVSAALQGVALQVAPFEASFAQAEADDFVYIDPPYMPANPDVPGFTGYTPGGFSLGQHRALAAEVARLDRRGVHVLASNADTPLARTLYAGLEIDEVSAPRAINSKATGRGRVNELLISSTRRGEQQLLDIA